MRERRDFLRLLTRIALGAAATGVPAASAAPRSTGAGPGDDVTLFLCGDVMTGRGIDQVLPHPSVPTLYESHARDARDYVALAERASGRIPRSVPWAYVWGEALAELARRRPAVRLVNLETSVTAHDVPWDKGINYRMHPRNVGCLAAAGLDACVLANNHVLDWQREGLAQTLATLRKAGIATGGAGADAAAAQAPAILPLPGGRRLLVFAAATGDSGVPVEWAATAARSGVHRLEDLSDATADRIAARVHAQRQPGDRVVFSVHWGGNWGYAIAPERRRFAHRLVDTAGVDLVHGHSSHHPQAVEVHRDRLVLYGCGDFLNDYEGIAGHDDYRGELGLMYFPRLEASTGKLLALDLVPTRIRKLRLERAAGADRDWLRQRLRREYARFGASVEAGGDGAFALRW
jgi:poly-gamma-glutamate synthesis protein (capsule biosynthesis protein)